MHQIKTTNDFDGWLASQDSVVQIKVAARLRRLSAGNAGDAKAAGDVSEMRIDFGPGYRVYFKRTGAAEFTALTGGTKKTQQADIKRAEKILKALKG